ncbi:Hpt domain-containing protein [Halopseudomonas pachastrellae]|nr:Hpt domain-containing protein [Halopseudomonas pachastrellae]
MRRAFHTLKGSGRMVQAGVLAELAWSGREYAQPGYGPQHFTTPSYFG